MVVGVVTKPLHKVSKANILSKYIWREILTNQIKKKTTSTKQSLKRHLYPKNQSKRNPHQKQFQKKSHFLTRKMANIETDEI